MISRAHFASIYLFEFLFKEKVNSRLIFLKLFELQAELTQRITLSNLYVDK